jgi:peptide/nickel transport system substrate-binding protein
MWAKIGVEVEIKAVDRVGWSEALYKRNYKHSMMNFPSTASPFELCWIGVTDGRNNAPLWSNKRFDELVPKIVKEVDAKKRGEMMKEATRILLYDVTQIPTDPRPGAHFWWPWIRNYHGERNVQDNNFSPVLARAWIDQDLKKRMGK